MPRSLAATFIAATLLVVGAGSSGASTAAPGPSVTGPPTVVGTTAAGKRLTALAGTWLGSGAITYGFQWHRCDAAGAHCTSIHGAVSATYVLVSKDIGKTLGLTVTATDADGVTAAYANLVGPIAAPRPLLVSTAQPVVSGAPVVGKAVQVTTGGWSPTPTKVTYAWERCNANGRICAAIANATGNAYTPTAADAGHCLLVAVQATSGPTVATSLSTASSAVVDAKTTGPLLAAVPTVTGTLSTGQKLSASAGVWTGAGPVTYAFQWYRCDASGGSCGSVHGATSSSYTLGKRDATKTVGMRVTATDATGSALAYTSLVGPIAGSPAALVETVQPGITGTAKVGQTLVAADGTWSPAPTSVSFAWQRCNTNGRACTPIAGATSSTYVVTTADAAHALLAVATAKNGSTTQTALSTATAAVG